MIGRCGFIDNVVGTVGNLRILAIQAMIKATTQLSATKGKNGFGYATSVYFTTVLRAIQHKECIEKIVRNLGTIC